MDFKDLQPTGGLEIRLQYELERVTSVCAFDPKLNTNEIDYYNTTIPHLKSVIENAIFYLKTNRISSNLDFNLIKIHLRDLNQNLSNLRDIAKNKGFELSLELSDLNTKMDSLLQPRTLEYVKNHFEIEQEIREFIKIENLESNNPNTSIFLGSTDANYRIFKSFIAEFPSLNKFTAVSFIIARMKQDYPPRIVQEAPAPIIFKFLVSSGIIKNKDDEFFRRYLTEGTAGKTEKEERDNWIKSGFNSDYSGKFKSFSSIKNPLYEHTYQRIIRE